jgi:cobalt-zinc-cadmium resistance protein CzcA
MFQKTFIFYIKIITGLILTLGPSLVIETNAQNNGFFQAVNLDSLVKASKKNNFDIRAAHQQIEKANTERSSVFELKKTRISYRYGNLHSQDNDRLIEIEQDFGSPLAPLRRAEILEKKIALNKSKKKLTGLKVEKQVKTLWMEILFLYTLKDLLKDQKKLLDEYVRVISLRYEKGESPVLERSAAKVKQLNTESRIMEVNTDIVKLKNQLSVLAGIEQDFSFISTDLKLYEIKKSFESELAGVTSSLHAHQKHILELKKSSYKKARSEYFPSFYAGYFNQSIGGTNNFDGWEVGMEVPLWFLKQKTEIKKAEIDKQIAEEKYLIKKTESEKIVESLRNELDHIFVTINYYRETVLPHSNSLIRLSRLRRESEDISFIEFYENIKPAFELKEKYWRLILEYNLKAIELEYYIN